MNVKIVQTVQLNTRKLVLNYTMLNLTFGLCILKIHNRLRNLKMILEVKNDL